MSTVFHENLAGLRKQKRFSQKKVAADLGLSQALLSHYENGVREPGLDFVCRACAYYEVSADMLLGRIEDTQEEKSFFQDIYDKLDIQSSQINALKETIKVWEETNSDR